MEQRTVIGTERLRTAAAVAEAILAAPQHPMDRATSAVMLRLTLAGETFSLPPPDDSLPFLVRIAKARASACRFPVTDAAVVMVAQLSDRPGTVVMYCAVLALLAARLERAATVSDLVEVFPMGFPDEAALTAIWDRQKGRERGEPDNWLDTDGAWKDDDNE